MVIGNKNGYEEMHKSTFSFLFLFQIKMTDENSINLRLPPIPTLEQINSDLDNFRIDSTEDFDPANQDVLFEIYKPLYESESSTRPNNYYNQAKQYIEFNLSIDNLNSLKVNENKIDTSLRYLNSLKNFISILKNFLINQK
jgi:hypothetical protein